MNFHSSTFLGKRLPGRKSPQMQCHAEASQSRHEHFADSNEIGRIYGVSPQRLEMIKHKSADDLQRLSRNNGIDAQSTATDYYDDKEKDSNTAIEGDAKLVSKTGYLHPFSSLTEAYDILLGAVYTHI